MNWLLVVVSLVMGEHPALVFQAPVASHELCWRNAAKVEEVMIDQTMLDLSTEKAICIQVLNCPQPTRRQPAALGPRFG